MVRIPWFDISLIQSESWCVRDRRKLTFYFIAEKRIDFRELVRELFRCAVTQTVQFWFWLKMFLGCIKLGSGWRLSRVVPFLTNSDSSDDPWRSMNWRDTNVLFIYLLLPRLNQARGGVRASEGSGSLKGRSGLLRKIVKADTDKEQDSWILLILFSPIIHYLPWKLPLLSCFTFLIYTQSCSSSPAVVFDQVVYVLVSCLSQNLFFFCCCNWSLLCCAFFLLLFVEMYD